ncbi:MAG: hypothetical protein ACRCUS_10340, partial [Anaerovoracaceae bacterium]
GTQLTIIESEELDKLYFAKKTEDSSVYEYDINSNTLRSITKALPLQEKKLITGNSILFFAENDDMEVELREYDFETKKQKKLWKTENADILGIAKKGKNIYVSFMDYEKYSYHTKKVKL